MSSRPSLSVGIVARRAANVRLVYKIVMPLDRVRGHLAALAAVAGAIVNRIGRLAER